MARLRDLKVGKTVWIVRGKTKPEDFSLDEYEVSAWIYHSGTITRIDKDDRLHTVQVADDWFWPTDWISLTPPEPGAVTPSAKTSKVEEKRYYVETKDYGTYGPDTLEVILEELHATGLEALEINKARFYEMKPVSVAYKAASLEVV